MENDTIELMPLKRLEVALTERDLWTLLNLADAERLRLWLGEGAWTALIPSDEERQAAVERLVTRWVGTWRLYDPWKKAAYVTATIQDSTVAAIKTEALTAGIFMAIADAREPQETRLGWDRLYGYGTDLILLQKSDLEQLAREGLTKDLLRRLGAEPVGQRRSWPYQRYVDPIEGAFAGVDPFVTRPTDLGPEGFSRWVRVRAIKHAEAWLLDASELAYGEGTLFTASGGSGCRDEDVAKFLVHERTRLANPDVLDAMVDAEEGTRRYESLLDACTPTQREILELMRQTLTPRMSLAQAKRIVADKLGIAVGAIDTALSRIRRRVPDRL